jgi:hypothetical protein
LTYWPFAGKVVPLASFSNGYKYGIEFSKNICGIFHLDASVLCSSPDEWAGSKENIDYEEK